MAARAADASQLDPLAIVVAVERFERGGMGNDLSQSSAVDGAALAASTRSPAAVARSVVAARNRRGNTQAPAIARRDRCA
jgi:hypothetical protein